ncbi:MAG: PspC domain-containing protein [Bacteroidales bacterium]|nr:PspC domain-containing protein [Bacteroidales bacterium]MBQ2109171.1 PspC domain-containing protein [Bacteroidales bacterium]
MKEVDNVSIGGYAFKLEKDASQALNEYIEALECHYSSEEGCKEIMEGIEERIAELLLEKTSGGHVANLATVNGIIDTIGRPEKIEAEDDIKGKQYSRGRSAKLFRDMENKRIGGVCSGLAAWLSCDVTIIRLIFVLFTVFGFAFRFHIGDWSITTPLVYLALWLCIPPAKTTEQRWAMKGENYTAEEIRKNVATGAREMKAAAVKASHSKVVKNSESGIKTVMGVLLLLIAVIGIMWGIVLFFGRQGFLFSPFYDQLTRELFKELPSLSLLLNTRWMGILLAAAQFIPFIAILYIACRLLFNFKSHGPNPAALLFVLWLVLIVVIAVLVIANLLSSEFLDQVVFWT